MASNENEDTPGSDPQNDINILLLGETGVGKSTFINSFVNYLQHTTFKNAMKSKLACLIPLRFTVPNENYEDRIVEFGADDNEDVKLGNSSTQGAKAYVFPFENWNIRLIDTPGIGDARGLNQDGINFENVLAYISQFEHLHAVCFLMKPNVSVINAYFKFCVVHLLSRLEKSAATNIVFIFTNCRSTFYRPGETLPLLKRILAEIKQSPPHVEVPCSKQNMFCVDNEAFKFLVATQQGIQFGTRETKEFSVSWKNSYKTCKEILSYICGDKTNKPLTPHVVQNTISVNEARRIIIDLSKPLADVCDLIEDNLTLLRRHEDTIQRENLSKKELSAKLYIPAMEIELAELPRPVTVCSASKCSEIYTIEGINKYHYKQRCHNPCYLSNVPKEIVGTPELMSCAAMSGDTCKMCGCKFSVHMHIYYESKVVEARIEDSTVKIRIKTKDDEINAKSAIVTKLKQVSSEYENEKQEISKCMAKFAHFLKENSISVYNDAYLDYLDYLIEREKLLGPNKDQERIKHYSSLKARYEYEKKILDETMISARKINKNAIVVTPMDVINLVKDLYKLPHTGSKIAKLHSIQQRSVQNSVKSKEYRHPTLMRAAKYESSSDDEDEDMKLIKALMSEDRLDAMRTKFDDMDLKGYNKEKVEEQKQILNSIYDVVKNKFKAFTGTGNTKGYQKNEGKKNSKATGYRKDQGQSMKHNSNYSYSGALSRSTAEPGVNFAHDQFNKTKRSDEQKSIVEKNNSDLKHEQMSKVEKKSFDPINEQKSKVEKKSLDPTDEQKSKVEKRGTREEQKKKLEQLLKSYEDSSEDSDWVSE